MKNQCKWCGRPEEGNPGDYYHEMGCWRADVCRRLDLAEEAQDHDAIERLSRELFRASYTGD